MVMEFEGVSVVPVYEGVFCICDRFDAYCCCWSMKDGNATSFCMYFFFLL